MQFSDLHMHLKAGEVPTSSNKPDGSWKHIEADSPDVATSTQVLSQLITQAIQEPTAASSSSSSEPMSMLDRYVTLEHIRIDIEVLVKQRLLSPIEKELKKAEKKLKKKAAVEIDQHIEQVRQALAEKKIPSAHSLQQIFRADELGVISAHAKSYKFGDKPLRLLVIDFYKAIEDQPFWLQMYQSYEDYPLIQNSLRDLELLHAIKTNNPTELLRLIDYYQYPIDAPLGSLGNNESLLYLSMGDKRYPIAEALIRKGASPDAVGEGFQLALNQMLGPDSPINYNVPYEHIDKALEINLVAHYHLDYPLRQHVIDIVREPDGAYSKLPKRGKGSFREVLAYLCTQKEWMQRHPNCMAIILLHAVKDIVPSKDVLPFLDACRDILHGSRGKNILYHAIENDKPIIVEHMLKLLGTEAFEPYGTPLRAWSNKVLGPNLEKQWQIRTFTPLQHAFFNHRLNSAELLLQAGASISTRNMLDNTIEDVISMGSMEDAMTSLQWRWLLRNLPADDPWVMSRKTMLLNEAIKTDNLSDIYYWLKQGAKPTLDIQEVIVKALAGGQRHLAELLWEKGYLTEMNDEIFEGLLRYSNTSWSQSFFEKIRPTITINWSSPKRIQDLVNHRAYLHQFLFVASLIAQGYASLDEISLFKSEIGHLVQMLQQGSKTEYVFRAVIDESNLGHLVGDSFLQNMTDDRGHPLAGNLTSNSLDFLAKTLRYQAEIYPETGSSLEPVIENLERARKIAIRSESITLMENKDQAIVAINDFADEVLSNIEQLKVGESLLLPAGWLVKSRSGHAIVMNCKKLPDDTVEIQLINTGEGLERHQYLHDTSRAHANTVKFYRIPFSRLKKGGILQSIMEPNVGRKLYREGSKRYQSAEVYHVLSEFEVSETALNPEELIRGWRKAQLAGTCSLRSLLAYLNMELPRESYRELVDGCKENVVRIGVDQFGPFVTKSPSLRKLLSFGVTHGYWGHLKRIGKVPTTVSEESFSRLESTRQKLQAALPSYDSQHEPLEQRFSFPTSTDLVVDDIKKLQTATGLVLTQGPAPVVPLTESIPSTPISNISTVKELRQFLTTLNSSPESMRKTPAYFASMISSIGRLFIDTNQHELNFLKLREALRKNPKACQKIISQLTLATMELARIDHNIPNTEPHAETSIAICYALAVSWELATLIDKKSKYPEAGSLTSYGVNLQQFLGLMEEEFTLIALLDPQVERDIILLANFTYNQHAKKFLFENSHTIPIYRHNQNLNICSITNFDPVYDYIKAHLNPKMDWRDSDAAYQKACDDFRKAGNSEPEISMEEWRVNWSFAHNLLPAYFKDLNRIAALARWSRPWLRAPDPAELHALEPRRQLSFATIGQRSGDGVKVWAVYRDQYSHPKPQETLFIPNNYNIAKHNPDQSKNQVANYLRLKGQNQSADILMSANRTHRDLMGIRNALVDVDTTTGIPLLIDYFERNINSFLDPSLRIFFEMSLFTPLRLQHIIESNPESLREISDFLKRALVHYEENIAASMEKAGSVSTVVFLLMLQQRLCNYVDIHGTSFKQDEEFAQIRTQCRADINKFLKHPDFQQGDVQRELHLALVDSYHQTKPPTLPEVHEILLSIATAEKLNKKDQTKRPLSPVIASNVQSVPFLHALTIKQALEADPKKTNETLHQIAEVYGCVTRPSRSASGDDTVVTLPWTCTFFPTYECKVQPGLIYTLDVTTGILMRNKLPVQGLPNEVKNSQAYRQLFGTQELVVTMREFDLTGPASSSSSTGVQPKRILEGSDAHGLIEIHVDQYLNVEKIRREISGTWYEFLSSTSSAIPQHPFISGKEEFKVWRSDPPDQNFIWIDPKTMQVKMRLNHDGTFIFPEDDPLMQWEWVNLDAVSGGQAIKAIDHEAYVLQQVTPNEKKAQRLVLPHLKGSDGKPLEFVMQHPVGLKEDRWVLKKQPHLFLSESQRLPEIHGVAGFLILESASGSREALIPRKSIKEIRANQFPYTDWIQVKIKDDQLVSRSPGDNAFLAYLALTHATTPKDYETALKFLKNVHRTRFERFSTEELQTLAIVFLSKTETKDKNVYSDLCRLYTAWLVHDNLRRNPSTQFVQGSQLITDARVSKDAKHYFARCHHLPYHMRIENLISPHELEEWGLASKAERYGNPTGITYPTMRSNLPSSPLDSINTAFFQVDQTKKTKHELVMRPDEIIREFPRLFNDALSDDPVRVQFVRDRIREIDLFDDPQAILVRTVLHAALHRNVDPKAKKIIDITIQRIEGVHLTRDITDKYTRMLKHYRNSTPSFLPGSYRSVHTIPKAQILPDAKPVVLPDHIPQTPRLPFKAPPMRIHDLEEVLLKNFVARRARESSEITPFTLPTNDPWLQVNVDAMNAEYSLGAKKNAAAPTYSLREGVDLDQFVNTEKPQIVDQLTTLQADLENEEEAILFQANHIPSGEEGLRVRAEFASGKRLSLTIKDCVGLFLQGDEQVYRQATRIQDPQAIAELHQRIGDYILRNNLLTRYQAVEKALNRLAGAQSESERVACEQQLADELSLRQEVQPGLDPSALMVFEYATGFLLKAHQIEGIRDMLQIDETDPTKFRSVLLQRIQGGGKSLVFGHIMALLKADGFHLSVHVPATAQYATAVYDMSQMSHHLFGQRERTLEFDDSPAKFTLEHLTHVKRTLQEVIVNREYITITNESLRALRGKYLKTHFDLQKLPEGAQKESLRSSHTILGEILYLLRTRGVLTVDEGHLALDPNKVLDLPFGPITHPNITQSELFSKIIRSASLATDSEGRPLLNIERTSEQTPHQRSQMIEAVIADLTLDPQWAHPDITRYLRGEIEDIPSHIQGEESLEFAKLVILAKQMLAGHWLEQRLSSNVNEHYGLTADAFPRVGVPFVASMKPAIEGTEFSSPDVMTTNTFTAYLAEGLNKRQVEDFIRRYKLKAISEKRRLRRTQPELKLENTKTALAFMRASGRPLFQVDNQNDQDILEIQSVLTSRDPDAMELMLDYVISKEFPEVDLYEHQVSTNGQNTFTMAQSAVSYSGSVENPNMAPLGMDVKLEAGTNGETIDVLIHQNTEVKLVDSDIDALFRDIIYTHPRKNDIRAIIDVGAHYRGVDNQDVAKNICGHLKWQDSPARGVLFFDGATDRLCYMDRDKPNEFRFLSGTSAATIAEETGFTTDELFTYYDQSHTTGVDIAQHPNALAIVTVSLHTQEHEMCQGPRRLRGLGKGQGIVAACPRSAVNIINATLQQPPDKILNIRDVLLYGRVKEALSHRPNNLLFALQKIENIPQQRILDRLLKLPQEQSEALFAQTSFLYDKNVLIDIYREYARKRKDIPVKDYLDEFVRGLLQPLQAVCTPEEIQEMDDLITRELLNEEKLAGMEPTVSVPHDFENNPNKSLANLNRQSSHVQHRQQVQQLTQVGQNVSQQEQQNQYLNQIEQLRKRGAIKSTVDTVFTAGMVSSESFGIPEPTINVAAAVQSSMTKMIPVRTKQKDGLELITYTNPPPVEPKIWNLTQALAAEVPQLPPEIVFDDRLLTTSNAAIVLDGTESTLLGPVRKAPWPVLLISDATEGNPEWKLILCSVKDGINFERILAEESFKLPPGRQMWEMRTNGKPMPQAHHWDPDVLNNPSLARLFVQAMLFSGDWQTLSQDPWLTRFNSWFNELNAQQKTAWTVFFENNILMGSPPGYSESELYDVLH